MNETDKVSTTSHALKNNTMFRDLIIRRERQKALRASLYAHQRKTTHAQQEALRQQTVRQMHGLQQVLSQDTSLDIRAAHFAHVRQHIIQAMTAWNRKRDADIIFIRREDRRGAYFQTFDKDARKTARILGMEAKRMKVNKRMVQYLSIPEKRMHAVFSELARRDLMAKVIDSKGHDVTISRKRATTPTLSVTAQAVQPKLDVMETLDRNRQDGRHTSIHVESLAVWADSKGNWKVSGMVNGQTVTAKSIDQADAVSYKKGEMSNIQLVEKYNLHEPPRQQNTVSRKSTLARRYSLDDT